MLVPNRKTVTNQHRIGRVLNRKFYDLTCGQRWNQRGVDIFEEDWDTLIILDACRYNLFQSQELLSGTLESRISQGSSTNEWIRANMNARQLHDTVYVSSNPMYLNNDDLFNLHFHAVVDVKDIDPKIVTTRAKSAHFEYPHKRVIVHYTQPHYPFLSNDAPIEANKASGKQNIWENLLDGEDGIKPEAVRESYRLNLDVVLPHVRQLIKKIDGTVVVSSDHGNMLGEPSRPIPTVEWEHPEGIYVPELVTVPWFIYQEGNREIRAEPPDERLNCDRDVSDRLKELGYVS